MIEKYKIKANEMNTVENYIPKFLILGASGQGKTHALQTFPPDWKVLVFDLMGNKETLYHKSNENISIIPILTEFPDPIKGMQSFRTMMAEARDDDEIKVVVLDCLTGLMNYAEKHALRFHSDKTGIAGAPAQLHYRGVAHTVKEMLNNFISIPKILVVNAHIEQREDAHKIMRNMPVATGRLRATIGSNFGEVYLAEKTETKSGYNHTWTTCPNDNYGMLRSTINRAGELWGNEKIEPNFTKLLERRIEMGVKEGEKEIKTT